jgi:hypothetical protein
MMLILPRCWSPTNFKPKGRISSSRRTLVKNQNQQHNCGGLTRLVCTDFN